MTDALVSRDDDAVGRKAFRIELASIGNGGRRTLQSASADADLLVGCVKRASGRRRPPLAISSGSVDEEGREDEGGAI